MQNIQTHKSYLNMFEIGVIPVAGRGLRLSPYTENTPKALFEIGGQTLLERNIDILVNKVHVKKIYVIHGHLGDQIIRQVNQNPPEGIKIEYVECADPGIGLAKGLLLLKDKITSPFVVILGDELYLNSNHETLLDIKPGDFNAVCGYMPYGDIDQIRQNYSLVISNGEITNLYEKPSVILNSNLGCGTFAFTPAIFDYIQKTIPSEKSKKVELIDAINLLAKHEGKVIPLVLKGAYKNINYSEDYINAIHLYRKEHFSEYKTSLVIPAYNEEASLAYVIDEFHGHVDEIIVAASISQDRTLEIAQNKADKLISGAFLGYGDALKHGMDQATGDIIILVEADGSFSADDLPKFLSYLENADMVIGTRTTKQLILQGANMDGALRWGNLLAAKFMQGLWFSQKYRFTDLGCTYRVLWKDCYSVIRNNINATGPEFSPEMMVEVMRSNRRIVEIPVTYRPRIAGESKHSQNWFGILKTATRMLTLIIKKRLSRSPYTQDNS